MRLVVIDEKWQTPMVETDKEYAEGKLGSIDYSIINK